jgi:hypothetical protein
MTLFRRVFFALLALTALVQTAQAGTVSVFVGYADSERNGAFFPSTFNGKYTSGTASHFVGDASGDIFDSGAIMVQNTGVSNVSITNLAVTVGGNHWGFGFWTSSSAWALTCGAGTQCVVMPGKTIVFAQTSGASSFDTSDAGGQLSQCCSNSGIIPAIVLGLNGADSTYNDTAQVLNTGGVDLACAAHDINDQPIFPLTFGRCYDANESLNWRLIGTTGITDPGGTGGQVPEPMSLALVGIAFAAMGLQRRRRV